MDGNLKVEDAISTSKEKMCQMCNEKQSKYCCPRCSILYCSLNCYKSEKHMDCSECFYRECITEELASCQADDESKRKMLDILKKFQADYVESSDQIEDILGGIEDFEEKIDLENYDGNCAGDYEEVIDSDDDDGIDLQERIKDLNLNDADAIWEALTEDERNEFEAMVSKGEVGSILPQWEPWWMFHKEKKLVEDAEKIDKSEEAALKKCPLLKQVSKLDSLTTVQPSPAIKFNITNVLASYACVMRYFNGELDPVEGTACVLDICANLDTNMNFDDPAIAIESVVQKCLQSNLVITDLDSLDVMKQDTMLILQGPSSENASYYCKAALSHLYQIFFESKCVQKAEKASKEKKSFSKKFPEHAGKHLPALDVGKVKKCIKKLEYYLSFVESFGVACE